MSPSPTSQTAANPSIAANKPRKRIAIAAFAVFVAAIIVASVAAYAFAHSNHAENAPAIDAAGDNDLRREYRRPIVAAGGSHSFALDESGRLYAAGDNDSGQLGLGDEDNRDAFTEVADLSAKEIVAISAGDSHSLAIDANGKLYAAGGNAFDQLGLFDAFFGDRKRFTRFAKVPFASKVSAVAAGWTHSFAIADGKVYAAGWNYGQLGLGDEDDRWKFAEIASLNGKKIVAVAAGGFHTLALSADGKVYAAGRNGHGQLGLDDNLSRETFELVALMSDKNITQIAAGNYHSLALDADGRLYAAGRNYFGQLGLDDEDDRWKFAEIASLNGKKILAIAAGDSHSLALDADGKVYGTGDNDFGQLGLGEMRDRNVWTLAPPFSEKKIAWIAAGVRHSLALDESGKVYAAGNNYEGQLGLSVADDRRVFTLVPLPNR